MGFSTFILGGRIPLGVAINKSLDLKMGRTHRQHYLEPLMKKVEEEEIDPSIIIAHRMKFDEAPEAYKSFGKRRTSA